MTYLPLQSGVGGNAAPSLELGALLWEWNGADLTQFDAAIKEFSNSAGSTDNASTALVVTVVADPTDYLGNVLRFTATALQGGGILAVAASELTLPGRYVVVCQYLNKVSGLTISSGSGPMVFFSDIAGDIDACLIDRVFGTNTSRVMTIVNDTQDTIEALFGGETFNDSVGIRGGITLVTTVEKRQAGETPSVAVVLNQERGHVQSNVGRDTSLVHDIASVGANWDGLDMDRFGIAINDGINGTTGALDFKRFAVYAHPDD